MKYVCSVKTQYENLSKEELITAYTSLQTAHAFLQSELSQIKFELGQLRRQVYSSKRERFIADVNPGQLSLLDIEPKQPEETQKVTVPSYERRKNSKKPSRNSFPEHLQRIVTKIYPPGYDESTDAEIIGWEKTELLNCVPAQFYVEQILRAKIKTKEGEIITAELPDRVIAKGIFGTNLIASILVDKYVDHLPLHRQCERINRNGINIAESTIGDVPRQVAPKVDLLYDELVQQTIQSGYLNVDETPTPVLDPKKKGKTHRGYFWTYHSPEKKLVLFDYRQGRGREGPDEMLKDFKGFLQTDGYSVYDAYENREAVTLVGCMAHARRYFEQALNSDRERAEHVMKLIQKLYTTERKMREAESPMSDQEIVALRMEESKPVLDDLQKWLEEHLNIVTPKSPLGKAITYMYSRWHKLTVYIDHAHLNIDNNLVENAIRPTVLGRKNYMFAGNHEAAQRNAMYYSLMGSCKLNGINPYEWLIDVLERLPDTKSSQLYTLLPNNWQPRQKN